MRIFNREKIFTTCLGYFMFIYATVMYAGTTSKKTTLAHPKHRGRSIQHPHYHHHSHPLPTHYHKGLPAHPRAFKPESGSGRNRHLDYFRKIYGSSEAAVEANLTTIFWMPKVFGYRYPLRVTTVNDVDKKLTMVSKELEKLPASNYKYLSDPGGAFMWRYIAHTKHLSPHSFGIAIDINSTFANYWQWDLQHAGHRIQEKANIVYRNSVPWEIVTIFEKYGFIWGGKWQHYDTMHFEYRPELLEKA